MPLAKSIHNDIPKRRVGLYPKFIVKRSDGKHRKGQKHEGCKYLVLDLTHDPHAMPAVLAYAKSARADGYGPLADDLERAVEDYRRANGLSTV